jgi:hypothetical protein
VHKNETGFIRQANPKKAAVGTAFFNGDQFDLYRTQMIV